MLKNRDAGRLSKFKTEAVAPLKESKEARHLRSQTATQRLKHSTRVPSGAVPDLFDKCNANRWEEQHFGKIALTGAVRNGELLRGKVSQGRPHPLSMALRCEGQTLKKKGIS